MKLIEAIYGAGAMEPEESLPWGDPGFSARMLANHLAQEHDWASRRLDIIKRQVDWLAAKLPPGGRALDLACGPGFYSHLLAARGFRCLGVDISPASIAYARGRAKEEGLAADYLEGDIRGYRAEGPFDGALFLFGEFNEFSPDEARLILEGTRAALAEGGFLLLETHAFKAVKASGLAPPSWWRCPEGQGLLSARPHLCLQENAWDQDSSQATLSYLLIDAETAEIRRFRSVQTAYDDERLRKLLAETGFKPPQRLKAGEWPVGRPFEGLMTAWLCRG